MSSDCCKHPGTRGGPHCRRDQSTETNCEVRFDGTNWFTSVRNICFRVKGEWPYSGLPWYSLLRWYCILLNPGNIFSEKKSRNQKFIARPKKEQISKVYFEEFDRNISSERHFSQGYTWPKTPAPTSWGHTAPSCWCPAGDRLASSQEERAPVWREIWGNHNTIFR